MKTITVIAAFGLLLCRVSICRADDTKPVDKPGTPQQAGRQAPVTTPDPQTTGAQPQATAPQAPTRPTGSLWGQESRSIIADFKAHRVGDTITIVVEESTSASSTAATKTSRADSVGFGGLTGGISGLMRPLGLTRGLTAASNISNSTSTNGSGSTSRTGSLTTKLTAVVKQVMPDGNLLIEGTREVTVNKEKQKVTITGTVRSQDIGADNTVSSINLANASIQYDGKGPIADKQRKGLLTTIFGWLF